MPGIRYGPVEVDGKIYRTVNAAGRALFPNFGKRNTKAWLHAFERRGRRLRFLSKVSSSGASTAVVTVSANGQIVIPRHFRERLALREGSKVEITIDADRLVLRPARGLGRGWQQWRGAFAGQRLVDELRREHATEVARDARRRP